MRRKLELLKLQIKSAFLSIPKIILGTIVTAVLVIAISTCIGIATAQYSDMRMKVAVVYPDYDDTEKNKGSKRQVGGISQGKMSAMISADSAMKQAQVQGSVATQINGKAGVLESEIAMDKGRGSSTEKKEQELADLQGKAQQAAQAQREVTDMTNELLRKNAQTLKMATIETAKESERGIVDIETLKATNESLISTLDEVMKIQEEGRQKRRDAEVELGRIEEELKQKLLQIRG